MFVTTARSAHLLICRFQAELKMSSTCGRPIFSTSRERLVALRLLMRRDRGTVRHRHDHVDDSKEDVIHLNSPPRSV